ncbi:septum formation family protein [Hoyosella sp. YIM 151337]|uniref:septum formation family protein n=1 Tax=Hoyosella sp. YIM 151337 TaxID=2992742 RepID=UPI002235DF2A|nr:septum formation family protein [Hoyosella sp. YIM 151337]MCW4354637.1 septum formation family protein [Hoyosella sp. YIM 151337]
MSNDKDERDEQSGDEAASEQAPATGAGSEPGDTPPAGEPDPPPGPIVEPVTPNRSKKGPRIAALVVLLILIAGGVTSYVLTREAADQEDEPSLTTVAAPETGAVAGEDFGAAQAGDCLTWDEGDVSDLTLVECSEEHRFEVAAAIDLAQFPGREFGPDAEFPNELRFAELRTHVCEPAVATYLGERFDPRGKFSVNLINPGEAGWNAGERTIRCGVQNVGTTGQVFAVRGHAADQDQSVTWEPGVCIGIDHDIPTDPVDCADPHAFEVVGVVNLADEFGDNYPSTEDQDRFLDERCRQLAAEYLGAPERLDELRLTAFWDTRPLSSWLAGSRTVNCAVGAQVDGAGFATIIGSAREEITINGRPPGEIDAPGDDNPPADAEPSPGN